jgi:hypothetical protein
LGGWALHCLAVFGELDLVIEVGSLVLLENSLDFLAEDLFFGGVVRELDIVDVPSGD